MPERTLGQPSNVACKPRPRLHLAAPWVGALLVASAGCSQFTTGSMVGGLIPPRQDSLAMRTGTDEAGSGSSTASIRKIIGQDVDTGKDSKTAKLFAKRNGGPKTTPIKLSATDGAPAPAPSIASVAVDAEMFMAGMRRAAETPDPSTSADECAHDGQCDCHAAAEIPKFDPAVPFEESELADSTNDVSDAEPTADMAGTEATIDDDQVRLAAATTEPETPSPTPNQDESGNAAGNLLRQPGQNQPVETFPLRPLRPIESTLAESPIASTTPATDGSAFEMPAPPASDADPSVELAPAAGAGDVRQVRVGELTPGVHLPLRETPADTAAPIVNNPVPADTDGLPTDTGTATNDDFEVPVESIRTEQSPATADREIFADPMVKSLAANADEDMDSFVARTAVHLPLPDPMPLEEPEAAIVHAIATPESGSDGEFSPFEPAPVDALPPDSVPKSQPASPVADSPAKVAAIPNLQQYLTAFADSFQSAAPRRAASWEAMLSDSIHQIEQELDGLTDQDVARRNGLEVYLRLLKLIQQQSRQSAAESRILNNDQKRSLRHQLDALAAMLNHNASQDPTTNHVSLESLKQAVTELEALADLRVFNGRLCTKISGFGNFKVFEDSVFDSDDQMLIYCELENQHSEPIHRSNGTTQYRTRIRGTLAIYDANHEVVQRQEFPLIDDRALKRRRDFFLYFPLQLNQLTSGDYRLELLIEDVDGNKTGTLAPALNFTVR